MKKSARNHHRIRRRLGLFESLEQRALLAGDITTGLVHHWTFDETSGDSAHDSAGTSDGTLVNWSPTEAKWEPGRVGGALRFGTGDDYVIAPQEPASGSYSVSFWLNVAERNAIHPRILNARIGNTVYINNESGLGVSFSANESSNTFSPDPPTYNTWEHYAINFNAATGQGVIYRSGAPVAIGTYIDTAAMPSWTIGHHFDITNHDQSLRGALDDLRVYDRLLTDDDIAELASLGTPEPVHQEPVHHWTFDETTGFTAHDIAGGADGILVNWNPTEPRWVKGKVGGAVEFSTADNMIVTPPAGTHSQWSVAFWVNLTGGTHNYPRVIAPIDNRDLWAYLGVENFQGASFRSRNNQTIDPNPPPYGEWSHFAINFDTISDVGTIYRDGQQVASGYFGDNSPQQAWVIGHNGEFSNHLDTLQGLLDDLRVYDRLLTKPEIEALAAMGVPTPPPTGLIHHWTFDETSGNLAEDVAGNNDGQLLNYGPLQTKWAPGKIGGAIRFSDSDDLVLTKLPITKNQYTFSFWLNQSGEGGFNPRIINPGDEDRILICQFGGNGVCISDNDNIHDPNLPQRNTWEHYAVTIDRVAGKGQIYRNGIKVASGNMVMPPPLRQWVMGHSATVDYHLDTLDGMLDDMRVYDRVLSTSEVQQLATLKPLVATTDSYSTLEDQNLVVDASQGVMKNDSILSAGVQSVVDVLPIHGQLTLNADGSFTYDPDNDYNGPDSFTYRLTDPQGNSSLATVALTIKPVNDAPSFVMAVDEVVVSDEMPRVFRATGDPVTSESLAEWAMNRVSGPPTASDEAGQSLTFIVTSDNSSLFADQPAIGNYGTLKFTPAPNVSGVAVVTVKLKDDGGTADGGVDTSVQTVQITIVKPHPWHNIVNRRDVTLDNHVAPEDALEIINFLNAFGSQSVPANAVVGPAFPDVTGDNAVAPDDALEIINFINAGGSDGGSPSLPGSASFVKVDTTTQGDWQGKYGSAGYALSTAPTSLPPSTQVTFTGGLTDLYDSIDATLSTNDPRALQWPGTNDRIASNWNGDYGFTLDINIQDGQSRQVALYMLDGPRNGRTQRLDVIDATTGQVLDTRAVEDFGDGQYLVWSLRGHVKIQFTNTANGINAVLSGVFFG